MLTTPISLLYNKSLVADLIGDAVITCGCQDSMADIICRAYDNMERSKSLKNKLIEAEKLFTDLNLLLRTVELHRD